VERPSGIVYDAGPGLAEAGSFGKRAPPVNTTDGQIPGCGIVYCGPGVSVDGGGTRSPRPMPAARDDRIGGGLYDAGPGEAGADWVRQRASVPKRWPGRIGSSGIVYGPGVSETAAAEKRGPLGNENAGLVAGKRGS
jgi:hypothetical protein